MILHDQTAFKLRAKIQINIFDIEADLPYTFLFLGTNISPKFEKLQGILISLIIYCSLISYICLIHS